MTDPLLIAGPADLDGPAVRAVAGGARLRLDESLCAELAERRATVLAALATGADVYGVNTGMGAQRGVRLSPAAQAEQSRQLMLARAVGGAPWLEAAEVRALLAARLGSFLSGDAGVSVELCQWLVTLLDHDALPRIPRDGSASAGEIVPLAHAFGHLAGVGSLLGDADLPAGAPALGPKEGVALIQGQPVATALALLRAAEARQTVRQWVVTAAAAIVVTGAPTGPYASATARGDEVADEVLAAIRALLPRPRTAPQAAVSIRLAGPVLAAVLRAADAVDAAAERALTGVSDSPAFLDGELVGTAGFHGIDLALAMEGLRVSLVHAARVGTARLHRLLDPARTGLPSQLSAAPGPQAGLVAVHKQAAGVVQRVAGVVPAVTGSVETALGQEDAQSFALATAEQLREAVHAARAVVAAEVLAIHQARGLGAVLGAALDAPLAAVAEALPAGVEDRPWGLDLATIDTVLVEGWPQA